MRDKFLIGLISAWVLTIPILLDTFLIYGPSLALPSLISTLTIFYLIPLRLYPVLLIALAFAMYQGQAEALCVAASIASALMVRLALEDSNQKLSWAAIFGTLLSLLIWLGLRTSTDLMLLLYGPFASLIVLLALTRIHTGLSPLALPVLMLSFCLAPKIEKPDRIGTALQTYFSPGLSINSPLTPAGLRQLLKSEQKTILVRMPSSPFLMNGDKPDWNPVWDFVRSSLKEKWPVWFAFRGENKSWLMGASEMSDLRNMLARSHAYYKDIKSTPSLMLSTDIPGVLAVLAQQDSSWFEWDRPDVHIPKHILHQPQRVVSEPQPALSLLHKTPMRLLVRDFTNLTGWIPDIKIMFDDALWLLHNEQIQEAEGLSWLMEKHPENQWHERLIRVKILAQMGAFYEAAQILAQLSQNFEDQGFLEQLAFTLGEAEARHVPYRAFDYEPILGILRSLVQKYPTEIKWARLMLLYQRQAQIF